jgi:hypothetical protein
MTGSVSAVDDTGEVRNQTGNNTGIKLEQKSGDASRGELPDREMF